MKNYRQLKKDLLRDRRVKKAYDELGPEFALVVMIIKKRAEKGWTQQDLAQRVGTKQSAISRLESGNYNPSVTFLKKVATTLGAKLEISMR